MRSLSLRALFGSFLLLTFTAYPATAQVETIFGMTAANSQNISPGLALVSFPSNNPGAVTTIGNFTGMVSGHEMRSISFQPGTNTLFALSSHPTTTSSAQLYTVNLTTAVLTPVGSGMTLTGNASRPLSMGFNPVTNEIRVAGQAFTNNNWRISPSTGTVLTQDTDFAFAVGDPSAGPSPQIMAFAHTNPFPGSGPTTVIAWDFNADALVRIGGPGGTPSPNTGVVSTISIPADFLATEAGGIGMAISGQTGTLYVTHDDPNDETVMSLYTRNVSTGTETLIGAFPNGVFISDIAIVPVPEPVSVLGIAGFVLAGGTIVVRRVRHVAGGSPGRVNRTTVRAG